MSQPEEVRARGRGTVWHNASASPKRARYSRAMSDAPVAPIREARPDDLDDLVELLGAFFAEDAAALPAQFAPASDAALRDYWTKLLASGEQRVFVATRGDSVVGVLTLEEVHRPAVLGRHADPHALIHLLAVARAQRRQGIATGLVRHAHDWSAHKGFSSVRLHVWEFNDTARRLYEHLGYGTLSRVMEASI